MRGSDLKRHIAQGTAPSVFQEGSGYIMSLQVLIREGESQEALLRRFQKVVQTSGVLRELKNHRHFMSKGAKARLKAQQSARRRRRQGNNGAR